MICAGENAVYNRPIAEMQIPSSGHGGRARSLFILICLCWSSASRGAEWSAPAQELARKIARVSGSGAIVLQLANRSSLSPKDAEEVGRELQVQLVAVGIRAGKQEQTTASVDVTLSENSLGYVWVAEIHRAGGDLSVVMVSVPKRDTPVTSQELPPMTLRKIPLWTQEARVLDVLVLEESASPTRLAVLDPDSLRFYRYSGGHWQQEQALPVTHSRPWPRDLRGRLWARADRGLDAYLPGVVCRTPSGSMTSLGCSDSSDPWPLSGQFALGAFFAPTRNFFTGALTPGIGHQTSIAKFYSAAPLQRQNTTSWVVAATDGTVHSLDDSFDQTLHVAWGGDVASVRSSCGSGWQILATQPGGGSGDSIRAYETSDHDSAAVSSAADFGGPITALWTENRGTSAIAVSKDATTELYEAFRLAVACGQ